jgi:hypothetical protein
MTSVTPQPKPPTNWLTIFKQWAVGRTGFTTKELVDIFANLYNLTPADRKVLEGQVKEEPIKPPTPTPPKPEPKPKPKPKPIPASLVITRTRFPKWWKDLRVSGITIAGSGIQTIVQGGSNFNVFIASITVITSGPTSVSFGFGTMGASGPMPLGDENQPMGMTISMSDSPAPCGQGGFTVHSIGGEDTLGGFVVYYVEKLETPG